MKESKCMKIAFNILKESLYALFLLASGSLAVWESMRLTKKYPQSNWFAGPSGFMMIIGCVFLLLCLLELLRLLRKSDLIKEIAVKERAQKSADEKENSRKMVISFLLLIVYTILIKYLGFSLTSAIYLGVNLWILKNPPLRTIITVVVILVLLLFGAPYMGISLPRGILGF